MSRQGGTRNPSDMRVQLHRQPTAPSPRHPNRYKTILIPFHLSSHLPPYLLTFIVKTPPSLLAYTLPSRIRELAFAIAVLRLWWQGEHTAWVSLFWTVNLAVGMGDMVAMFWYRKLVQIDDTRLTEQ